jgi:hypothetical protein
MITILCASSKSVYKTIPHLDVWDSQRNAYYFYGSNPVITHAPCAQWSRLREFARKNEYEKDLAFHCLKYVIRNGGIFEHPSGSSFFREVGITKGIYSVDQSWWGFPTRKRTYLFFSRCKPLPYPILKPYPEKKITELHGDARSVTVLDFANWMIQSIKGVTTTPLNVQCAVCKVKSTKP